MSPRIHGGVRRLSIQFIGIVLLIGADLGSKEIVHRLLQPIGTYPVLDKIFEFSYVENTGAAWGMLSSRSLFLSLVVSVALILMLFYMIFTKETRKLCQLSLSIIFSGGAANLVDRLLHGYVTDYLHVLFIDFPVFNLADCYIVVGCFLLIALLAADMIREYRQGKAGAGDGNEAD